ncbi:rRNA (cytosine-C5-)-methyltransferase nop2 [Tulasnella sp. 330]|nr:rRNA (cytosine-C5-)-methyltransferase nop2 [Tulasnella sp. 330]KAG8878308.1 rRNA (cytosine-C5-)-methyltransferase nop2 [Tulasnella sp. 331]KAG8883844.1 rRNA (cytosine-C5-)-methyltransferase nop2 [Tulasnella sp. 332]
MGRKQRTKQADPAPLEEHKKPQQRGKRKIADNVDHDVDDSERSMKKARSSLSKSSGKDGAKRKGAVEKKQVKAKAKVQDSEDSDEGWGGVAEVGKDDEDLKAHSKFNFEDEDEEEAAGERTFKDEFLDADDAFAERGPVQELEFSDDEGNSGDDDQASSVASDDTSDSDSDSDSDGPITAKNMERRSKALDQAVAREEQLDQEEVAAGDRQEDDEDDVKLFDLPTAEELELEKTNGGLQVQDVLRRLQDCARVLNDFKKLASKGRSRSEYVEQLMVDMSNYYGYNEFLTEKLFNLFPVSEAIEFFEANEIPRPVTIRTNTLRTRRRDLAQTLINRGVNLEPIGKWTTVGLQVFESTVPVGATPEYLAGHYMLQAASSFLPVMALQPQPHERILDMASAPGGKATYISALMQNTGIVFANDSNKARTKSLTANVHRLGCKNVVVCSYDGREFPKVIGGFDRVLLDAPCSGTGVISKDASVKLSKSERDFQLLSNLQRQLILCAIDSVNPDSKTGGFVVYSTCSVTVDENESVVDYALRKRPNVELVKTGLEFGVEGFVNYKEKKFHKDMKLTRRYYPHVHNMDGFYVAKLKVNKVFKKREAEKAAEEVEEDVEVLMDLDPVFEDEEDKEFMRAQQRKHLLKTKGIKLRPKSKDTKPPAVPV